MTGGRLVADPVELAACMAIFEEARRLAMLSTCKRARCGAVVHGVVAPPDEMGYPFFGRGFNSPPSDSAPRCERKHELSPGFKSDRTCCVHAEVRAAREASYSFATEELKWDGVTTRMYFVRINDTDEIQPSGEPYCTICSKEVLDVGINEWALIHADGIRVYTALEYNDISFAYGAEG